ncbi:MAG: 1-deoxy-D-xylulose-5-phosphate reductoisomerase, partial [Bacilli bacterium]
HPRCIFIMISICLLGASGSIGSQTLDVIKKNPDDFLLCAISIGHQTKKIGRILQKFPSVQMICVQESRSLNYYQKKYPHIRFFCGNQGLLELIKNCGAEMIVNALVGFVGLKPTLFSLEENRIVALANKESLVVGGELIDSLLSCGKGRIIPIDSEHVALSKCLSVDSSHVKNLILTASGGSFRSLNRQQLADVTVDDALKHPTWKMGNKITIDSATMMNKAFEIIEAHYLFGYPYSHIKVVLHDESYVHSMVQYQNGTYRLDISHPDMRVPIKYALFQGLVPYRTYLTDDYHHLNHFHFHPFLLARYPVIKWARVVIQKKGTYGTVLNAANEVAVSAFLCGDIPFLGIEKIVAHLMKKHINISHPTFSDIEKIDIKTRQEAKNFILSRYL